MQAAVGIGAPYPLRYGRHELPSQALPLEVGDNMQVVQQATPFGIRLEKCARKAADGASLFVHQHKLVGPFGLGEAGMPQYTAILRQGALQEIVAKNSTVGCLPATGVQLR